MRIVSFSDSHRNHLNVHKLFEQTELTTDLYIFLGDGVSDLDNIFALYPNKKIVAVAGNCDWHSKEPYIDSIEVKGKKIVFTHGHLHDVRWGLDGLERLARQNSADIVLYGHTHIRSCEYKNGVYFINPGSLGSPRDGLPPCYAAIDIIPAGVLCTHAELD